jgi:two-component system response regulator FixJ
MTGGGREQVRIAVLDDDASVRSAVGRLLRAADFLVDQYASFGAFRKSLEQTFPGCLVLDLHMPDMDGIDVMNYLIRSGIKVPIVVVSGHDTADSRKLCLSLGALCFLGKPVDADDLLRAVDRAVSQPPHSLQ